MSTSSLTAQRRQRKQPNRQIKLYLQAANVSYFSIRDASWTMDRAMEGHTTPGLTTQSDTILQELHSGSDSVNLSPLYIRNDIVRLVTAIQYAAICTKHRFHPRRHQDRLRRNRLRTGDCTRASKVCRLPREGETDLRKMQGSRETQQETCETCEDSPNPSTG